MEKRPINVLVVEDSPVMRLLLTHAIDADPNLHVTKAVESAESALEYLADNRPDVVLMDAHLPEMNGFDATRRIMETRPLPIVVCSATAQHEEVDLTFRALDAGAVAFVEKPVGLGHERFDRMAAEMMQTLRLMSEVAVVKRIARSSRAVTATSLTRHAAGIRIVAMGASTGGPSAIRAILSELPQNTAVPILVVQHIAAGFLAGMAVWLERACGRPVRMATHGEQSLAGCVYLAPDGVHMGVGPGGHILLNRGPAENGMCPAVSYLFRSVAGAYGARAAGVLLTGMGSDGAAELKMMKDRGAVTIAQDAESSIVHGMPGEAIRLGAATHVLSPPRIAELLSELMTAG